VADGVTVTVTVPGHPSVVHRPTHHPHGPLAGTGMDVNALLAVATAVVALAAGLSRWRNRSGVDDA
jgi:hypothetical protein